MGTESKRGLIPAEQMAPFLRPKECLLSPPIHLPFTNPSHAFVHVENRGCCEMVDLVNGEGQGKSAVWYLVKCCVDMEMEMQKCYVSSEWK